MQNSSHSYRSVSIATPKAARETECGAIGRSHVALERQNPAQMHTMPAFFAGYLLGVAASHCTRESSSGAVDSGGARCSLHHSRSKPGYSRRLIGRGFIPEPIEHASLDSAVADHETA